MLRILWIQHALGERGWFAVLSSWHGAALAVAEHTRRDDPLGLGPVAADEGRFGGEAGVRWRRLATSFGADPDDPDAAVGVLEQLGLLGRRRLGRRWKVVDPMPGAVDHPALDEETRRAAVVAVERFAVGMAVGGLLEEGGGVHEAAGLDELAAAAGTTAAVLGPIAADAEEAGAWGLTVAPDGRARLEQLPDPELDQLLAEVDDLPGP